MEANLYTKLDQNNVREGNGNITERIEQIRKGGQDAQVKMVESQEPIGQHKTKREYELEKRLALDIEQSLMNGLSAPSHIPQLISNSYLKEYFDRCHQVNLNDKCLNSIVSLIECHNNITTEWSELFQAAEEKFNRGQEKIQEGLQKIQEANEYSIGEWPKVREGSEQIREGNKEVKEAQSEMAKAQFAIRISKEKFETKIRELFSNQ